jgi:hypothetical protein
MNFFLELGAYRREAGAGVYRVDPRHMRAAVERLAAELLEIRWSGDPGGAARLLHEYGQSGDLLHRDVQRIESHKLPLELCLTAV